MKKFRVLFLCSGNSCRSQMAEAIVNARMGDRWDAFSAGSRPAGYVHPLAIQVLSEIGIDHQGRSKSISEFFGQSFDVVITLCNDSDEDCPVWLGPDKVLHRPFADPAKTHGSQAKILQAFQRSCDDLSRVIPGLLEPADQ